MQQIKTQYDLSDFLMKNLTGKHVTTMEKMVLCSIASFSNPDNGWKCWPSIDTIMTLTCATRPTVVKASKSLKQKGLLGWEKGKVNVSNKYMIDVSAVSKLIGVPAQYSSGKRLTITQDEEDSDAPF